MSVCDIFQRSIVIRHTMYIYRKCANTEWIWGQYFRFGCLLSKSSLDKSVSPKTCSDDIKYTYHATTRFFQWFGFFIYLVSAFERPTNQKNGSNSNQPSTHTHSHFSHKYRVLFVYTFQLSFFRLFSLAFQICCRLFLRGYVHCHCFAYEFVGFFWHPFNCYREKVRNTAKTPKANIMEICLHVQKCSVFCISPLFLASGLLWQRNTLNGSFQNEILIMTF